jgi:PAS domain-containing protein
MGLDWFIAATMGLSAVFAAVGAVLILAALQSGSAPRRQGLFDGTDQEVTFLFVERNLMDATAGARAILSFAPQAENDLSRLILTLASRFPELESRLNTLENTGQITLSDKEDASLSLLADLRGGITRIVLVNAQGARHSSDHMAVVAMDQELGLLRTTVSRAPFLIWREDLKGQVVWANAAYAQTMADQIGPDTASVWPIPGLFDQAIQVQGAHGNRFYLKGEGAAKRWFDIQTVANDQDRISFALPADAVVQAEATLRDFMQTLTKTFAHLPTGLAIFDRQRHLQLFNPALVDLSGLPPDFLSMRPSLFAVLDAMRDRNMIPEPKNYRHWRNQIADMEKAAASGLFEETWSLPAGQTYRVIGRPHPNGALALMFDDISSEVGRSRRYRADLELGQSVIDAMDDAVAVFAQSGLLVMTNAAYADVWDHDPAIAPTAISMEQLSRHWRAQSAPTPLWEDADRFMESAELRDTCSGDIRLLDGRLVSCRFTGLQHGAMLVAFRPQSHPSPRATLTEQAPRKTA